MPNEKPRYLRGNEGLVAHTSAVYWLIENEPSLLPKSMSEIRHEIASGLCVLALLDDILVGYVSISAGIYDGRKFAKVSSHVVDPDTRRQGIGTDLARRIYNLAKELYTEHKVITVVGPENVRKFERLGMVRIDKHDVPKEFIDTTSIKLDIDTPHKIILIEP